MAVENPTAWHRLIAAGIFEPGGMFLNIEEETEKDVLAGKTLSAASSGVTYRSPAEIERIQAICAGCAWNVEWVCEHVGCLPCRHRRSGGLKAHFIDPAFKCSARKWS